MNDIPSDRYKHLLYTFLYLFAWIVSLVVLLYVHESADTVHSPAELLQRVLGNMNPQFIIQPLVFFTGVALVATALMRLRPLRSFILLVCVGAVLAVVTFGGGPENAVILLTVPLAIFLLVAWVAGMLYTFLIQKRMTLRVRRVVLVMLLAGIWVLIVVRAITGFTLDVDSCLGKMRETEQGRCLTTLAQKTGDFSVCGNIPPSYGGSHIGHGLQECVDYFMERPELLLSQSAMICDSFTPQEAKGMCVTALGIAQNDLALCRQMPIEFTSRCFAHIAVQQDDFEMCLLIPKTDVWSRDGCIEEIAIARSDSVLCNSIERTAYAARCRERVSGR